MFRRLLIANRGEVAVRVARAARELGIAPIGVASTADLGARWLACMDEVVCLGPAAARESYLALERVVQAAVQTQCSALHPGWGFLSENPRFAALCEQHGITFVGPPAAAMETMGRKAPAKAAMRRAKVPVIPGSLGLLANVDEALESARQAGYPVILKADAGGGGRGMRKCFGDAELRAAFGPASAEAEAAFGSGAMYLEKYLEGGRHIEVQVLADRFGHCIQLGERECSVQRNHQKLVEESPSPALDARQRAELGALAVRAARSIHYAGAGTIEFLRAESGEIFFMEMNTRLQVEHGVSELVSGVDIVIEQLRIAANERLSRAQADVALAGHAIEVRVNAEDPEHDFRPSPGTLARFEVPLDRGPGRVRVDTHMQSGDAVSPFYDSLIAKVIAHASTRDAAIATLLGALGSAKVEGVKTTIPLHLKVLASPEFSSGRYDTRAIPGLAEFERGAAHAARRIGARAHAAVKIFLSHAAADGAIAEQVTLALRELDCDVFFDRASLAPGEDFHEKIREQLESSDLFVILVSRNSLREHSYCLTEIEFAERRWPRPTGHVLPVMIEPLKPADLPAFLTAVTYLEPVGNVVAETAAAVALLARRIRRRQLIRVAAVVAAVAVVASVGVALYRGPVETGPVHALAGALRRRARAVCASNDAGGSRLLIALADPPELVEFERGDAVRVLAKLDAEPVALAGGDGLVAVATTSPTPIHLFRGAGLDPLAPLAITFACADSAEHVDGLATRPVELAVFDGRAWVRTEDTGRAPGFSAYTPETEQWKLPYYGSYTFEQLVEFGGWARGARLRVVDEHLYALTRDGDHGVLAVADEELAVLSEAADGPFACARDIAQGPERSFVLLGCDDELVRLTRDDIGDFERESLGKVVLPPHAANAHIDHFIACAPGRVLLALTARDGSDSGPLLWTQFWTWDQVTGLRNLHVVDKQEAVSIATTPKFGVAVLHSAPNAWDALEVVY